MVRETKTLGEGIPATASPSRLPTVKNIAVYDSTRQLSDWEVAAAMEKVGSLSNNHTFYHKMQDILGRKVADNVDSQGMREGEPRSKTFYHMMMSYRRRQKFGVLEVGQLAKILHSLNMKAIAESLDP